MLPDELVSAVGVVVLTPPLARVRSLLEFMANDGVSIAWTGIGGEAIAGDGGRVVVAGTQGCSYRLVGISVR
jgi:hypothetical protein